ncbi:MAG TPA: biotin transporter BioY [Gemmatimonadales bacterium]|nr:biotin transporter BioY [Gemmatimonadales bacterium]
MNTTQSVSVALAPSAVLRRSLAVLAGVLLVALAAQVSISLPGTVVPITLQVPAVLIVGALLGPRLAVASMVTYLVLGSLGVPVFAPAGLPGFARLMGPTGGYLLAFPVAAGLVGHVVGNGTAWGRIAVGLVGGLLVVHAGGVAQLAVLTGGEVGQAIRIGSLPFLSGDAIKLAVALLLVRRLTPLARARL